MSITIIGETIKKKCFPYKHFVFVNYFSHRLFSGATCEQKASFLTFILHIVINLSQVSMSDATLFNICLKSNVHLSHYNWSDGPIRKDTKGIQNP